MRVKIEITYESGRVERKLLTQSEWKKIEPKYKKLTTIKSITTRPEK